MLRGSPRTRSRGIAVPILPRCNLFLVSREICPRLRTCGIYRVVSCLFDFHWVEHAVCIACSPPRNLFVVDAELVAFLQFVFPYPNPHAVVVRCALYMGGLESSFLQCFDCTFALFLCHCLCFSGRPRTHDCCTASCSEPHSWWWWNRM